MSKIESPLDLYRALYEPFDADVKETANMGAKGRIIYVEWYHYIARAWKTFPAGFSTEITKLASVGNHLILVVRVIDSATGNYQEATGSAYAEKEKKNFGGANAEAESQALRRAFAKFGLGLEMYMDSDDFEQADPDAETATEPEPEQLQRMKQLVKACEDATREDSEFDEGRLEALIANERQAVKDVRDKKFRIGLAIEVLEKAMAKEGLDVPDPS